MGGGVGQVCVGEQWLCALLDRLLVGASLPDSGTARLALQALQSLATHQVRSLQGRLPQHCQPFRAAAAQLVSVTDKLVTAVFYLPWDRADALGNALSTYIALDTVAFTQSAQAFIARQSVPSQQALIRAFEQLTCAREVDLHSIEKPNRVRFGQNFREFLTNVKALVLV
ncbi:hypothetical protein B484DRAFT_441910 [Ochromonadaceae sp. CCMP2298]|nr:hypothetical protein B484DRAFT_441910 [Ochromonadaceae sp. CCMP2298]|mmetsp:Transcript_11667/g.26028  ORF Transcript_11667/g.26028 Transcript_11667/m.26028 type:complete len:170 (+) Transcript_11667:7-516(+)